MLRFGSTRKNKNIDAYVMDASAIDAPFVLSKVAKAKANTDKPRPGTVREGGAGRIFGFFFSQTGREGNSSRLNTQ